MRRPLVSIIVPALNEAAIIAENLGAIRDYLETIEDRYRWELIVVNDGSTDETGMLINEFAANRPNVVPLHHAINFQLGQPCGMRSTMPAATTSSPSTPICSTPPTISAGCSTRSPTAGPRWLLPPRIWKVAAPPGFHCCAGFSAMARTRSSPPPPRES
jgi:hypothetical protein